MFMVYLLPPDCNNVHVSSSRSFGTNNLIQLIILPDVQIDFFYSDCDVARSGFTYASIFYLYICINLKI